MNQVSINVAGPLASDLVQYQVGERDVRPWGNWEVLATGAGYVLKRIVVLPEQRLSLQYHHFRSEQWTVVQGTAEAYVDGILHPLNAGEHIFIPLGAHHRIKNSGSTPLVLIEVQVGELLDERDIVRITDDYGRS
jgi:mannose-6-phosphate isomerase